MPETKLMVVSTWVEFVTICEAICVNPHHCSIRRVSGMKEVIGMDRSIPYRVVSRPSANAVAATDRLQMSGHREIHTDEEMMQLLGIQSYLKM